MWPIPRERRRHVAALVKRVGLLQDPGLSAHAQLTYVIGALVADDTGYLPKQRLEEAFADQRIVGLAANMLAVIAIDGGL